jgi:hypothetical protein
MPILKKLEYRNKLYKEQQNLKNAAITRNRENNKKNWEWLLQQKRERSNK